MRRKDREMNREFALSVVDKCEYATLATVSVDGSPYIVPISFVRINEDIFFHCAPVGHKLENLHHESRVCLNFVTGVNLLPEKITTEYESAIVFGTASEVDCLEKRTRAMAAIMKKYSSVIMHKFGDIMKTMGTPSKMSVWRVHIDNITGKCNDQAGKYQEHKLHQ